MIGTALGWEDLPTIVLAIALAFVFRYSLTLLPLLRSGLRFRQAIGTALAPTPSRSTSWRSSTTRSSWPFPGRFPTNRALIARGLGHAVVHGRH